MSLTLPFCYILAFLSPPLFPTIVVIFFKNLLIITIAPHLIFFSPTRFLSSLYCLLAENGAKCSLMTFVLGVGALWRSLNDFCLY